MENEREAFDRWFESWWGSMPMALDKLASLRRSVGELKCELAFREADVRIFEERAEMYKAALYAWRAAKGGV